MNPRRPADKYELQGCGFHACVGTAFSEATIPEVLKQIFRLKNLRRAEGPAGRLAGFSLPTYGTESPVYLDDAGNMSYWPGAMTLVVSRPMLAWGAGDADGVRSTTSDGIFEGR